MGKRTKTRRRGQGSPKYRCASHRFITEAKYRAEAMRGVVTDLKRDPSKSAILMEIKWEDGTKDLYIAPEGVKVGEEIVQGGKEISIGNVVRLKDIPEGIPIFNVEAKPGDGGKLARASGAAAMIIAKQKDKAMVRLPSKRIMPLDEECKATIGVAAGGGRTEKPLIKAGRNYLKKKAKSHPYPVVRGVAMNPVSHPHGGSQHHAGKATTKRKTSPPGKKVGHIGARRTGRKKRK